MAESSQRDGETARAPIGPDDDTAVLPDLAPTEHVALAWSAERPEPDPYPPVPNDDAPIPPMPAPVEPRPQARKTGAVLVVFWLLMAGALLYSCSTNSDDAAGSSASLSATSTTSPPPSPYETMPGDGTYSMGGADGKDWGIWESSGGPTDCQWSIRAVNRYTPGQVLDSGQAVANQRTRVSIQPLPDSSGLTGEAHGFRVVFMTSGCGAWRVID